MSHWTHDLSNWTVLYPTTQSEKINIYILINTSDIGWDKLQFAYST